MSLFNLQMPRSYADGRTYFAAYIDEQKVAVEEWAQQMVYNLSQLALDIFGTTYSYGPQGLATRATPVLDAFAAIAENEAITGSWTFSGTSIFSGTTSLYNGNNFNIYSDAGSTSKLSVAGSSGNTLIGGTLGITGNTTVGGTFGATGNSTIGGTLGVNGAATLSSTLDVTGNSILTRSKASVYNSANFKMYSDEGNTEKFSVLGTSGNVQTQGTLDVLGTSTLRNAVSVWSNYNLLGYSDNGSTVIYGFYNTGEAFLKSNDPPSAFGRLTSESGVKAYVYYEDGSGIVESYNIDSIGDDDGDGYYTVLFDVDFPDVGYAMIGNVQTNLGGSRDAFITTLNNSAASGDVYVYDVGSAGLADASFSVCAFGLG